MKFCTNCGAQMSDESKFCTNCGQSLAAPAQQSYTPPQQSYTPPQQQYTAPLPNNSYTPPQQSYTPPQQGYTPPQQPEKKKKKGGKKIGLIILLVILALGIGVFAISMAASSDDPNLGLYTGISQSYGGVEMGASGEWIELKAAGIVDVRLNGDTYTGTWKLNGTELVIKQSGDTFYGTLQNGVITMDFAGLICTYSKSGSLPTTNTNTNSNTGSTQETPAANPLDYWSCDWYGWWIINTVYTGNSDWENNWWDICGTMKINPDGSATFILWDEDYSKEEPMAEVKLTATVVDGDQAKFVSRSGYFMDSGVGSNDWSCNTNDDIYDELFWISCNYDDGEYNFDYTIYMRRWGNDWSDIAGAEPELLPYFYQDWYLPLIHSGVTKAPSVIGE